MSLEGLRKEIEAITAEETSKLALELIDGLITKTPIDTGRAKGNWYLGVGKPINLAEGGRRQAEARTEAKEAIIAFESIVNNTGNIPVLFINNNLPYINKLNEGSSQQAPSKFIETEILRVTRG